MNKIVKLVLTLSIAFLLGVGIPLAFIGSVIIFTTPVEYSVQTNLRRSYSNDRSDAKKDYDAIVEEINDAFEDSDDEDAKNEALDTAKENYDDTLTNLKRVYKANMTASAQRYSTQLSGAFVVRDNGNISTNSGGSTAVVKTTLSPAGWLVVIGFASIIVAVTMNCAKGQLFGTKKKPLPTATPGVPSAE